MKIEYLMRTRGWLLAAALLAGGVSTAGADDSKVALPPAPVFLLGKSMMSADEVRALNALPAAERRSNLDLVLAAHPDDLTARFLRTQADATLADSAATAADSERALADPSLDRQARQRTLEWRAEALVQLQRFDEAIVAANQALEIAPSSPEALLSRGWARYWVDQNDGALADLDHALRIDPENGGGYYRRGIVLREQGEFDLAIKDFRRTLELVPNDGPTHGMYGALLYRLGDLDQALVQFDAAVQAMPNDLLALTWRGQTNRALKRFDAATADDERASQLGAGDGHLVRVVIDVGLALEDQKDFAGAAREFERAEVLKPTPATATSLIRAQWFAGEFEQAAESLRKYGGSPTSGDYIPIWLFVMRGRANPSDEPAAKADLASQASAHQPHVWTDTLVDLLLGKSTLEAALAEADAAETDKLRAGDRCEADYYTAEQLLMHHPQDAEATRRLEEASRVCPPTYIEARAVDAERRLLAARSPSK